MSAPLVLESVVCGVTTQASVTVHETGEEFEPILLASSEVLVRNVLVEAKRFRSAHRHVPIAPATTVRHLSLYILIY